VLDEEQVCDGCRLGEFHPAFCGPLYGPLCRECEALRLETRPEPRPPRSVDFALPSRQHHNRAPWMPLVPVVCALLGVVSAVTGWWVPAAEGAALLAGAVVVHLIRSQSNQKGE